MNLPSWFNGDHGSNVEVLWEDGERVFCRGVRHSAQGTHDSVLAILPTRDRPTRSSLARLMHEYGLRDDLDGAWAVRPVELVREGGRTILVLEDCGGAPLERLLGRPLEPARFLRLAIALTTALGRLHERGFVHKDVKPANVLVSASDQVRLTGFGIASRIPRERQAPEPPQVIAGTLAYMAPEQTGRMNRSVDARSDLYALGVTLYQMLTGELPFSATDPMELVHCHIARRPVPPAERAPGVAPALSAVVMKLLAKTAEDRYQTAAGVAADLRRCLEAYESGSALDVFALGEHDVPDVLRIPEKLYGRETEVGALLDAFNRVVERGLPELVLISGYSGIGKSSVVNELHKAIVAPRGLFASGKFDQYQRDVPYATLAQAFRTLVRQILAQSEIEVAGWRADLGEALGPHGRLMVELIPELELVIGPQPSVPELPAQEAQTRFQLVFRRMIGVFARPHHPLALFLDDLQWLDAATLSLFTNLATQSDVTHLLLVGAYRDNEVGPSHPLMRSLEAISHAGVSVREIVLAPLARDDVVNLVSDSLHCERTRARPLADLVFEKTGGNPFFAIQFLTTLADESLLGFNAESGAWLADLARINAKGYTDNVVDLMVGKLTRLPDETRQALKDLACLGNAAAFETLALVQERTVDSMHVALRAAAQAGLVFRREESYAFLHDRVQEAAYSLIPAERRAETHLRIGRLFLENLAADEITERIFDVANQFNLGAVLPLERDERVRIAELNLRAGHKARAASAYASARNYFTAGMKLLDSDSWIRDYPLAYRLWLDRAECEYLTGNFDAAEALIAAVLARAASKVDAAAAYRLKIDLHVMKSENPQAVDSALTGLRLFGIEMDAHPTDAQVQEGYVRVWRNLGRRPIESLVDLPAMTDPEITATMRVLSGLFAPAYFTDINLVRLHLCHMVNLSLEHGTSDASPAGFSWFGITIGSLFGRYEDGYRFARLACDLVEKRNLIAPKANVYFSTEMVVLWTQPVQTALDYIRAAHRAGVEGGDLTVACYSCNHAITDLLAQGTHLEEVWHESERGLDFARKAKFRDVVDIIVSQQRFIANLQGRTASFSTFGDAAFDEAAFEAELTGERMATMVCWYWILKLQARFLSGDHQVALRALENAQALLWSSDAHIQLLDYHYYAALTLAAQYDSREPATPCAWRTRIDAHLAQLREWADKGAAIFRDKHELVAAEVARLEGRDLQAQRLYEQAIRSARESGFVQNEAIASELAARWYAARGLATSALAHLRNARDGYLRWGAEGKVRQLEESHPQLRAEPAASVAGATAASAEGLDLASVVKISQAVSGEIVLERLIDKLMSIALEHAGAQRGLLILPHGEAQRIQAEAAIGVERVQLGMRHAVVTPADLPESILRYVARAQESVLLHDASLPNPYSSDPYIARGRARSILCLPLLKQTKLIGVLYLENPLAPGVFTPARIAVLNLLASQAAISLENARLYAELGDMAGALRRSEERYTLAMEATGEGFWDWNTETDEFYVSPRMKQMYGLTADTMFANRAEFLARVPFHPDDKSKWQRCIDAHFAGETERFEVEIRVLPHGVLRWIQVTGLLKRDASGRAVRWNGTVSDITARKQAQEELVRLEGQLRQTQRLESMGTLAGGIAHDFNNILGAILGYGEMALRSSARGSRMRRDLDSIMTAAERGRALVDRILAFSRSGVSERVPVHVEAVVYEALDQMAATLPAGIAIDAKLQAGRAALLGDPTQVDQILTNLVTNAVHAMVEGGTLRVSLNVISLPASRLASTATIDAGEYVVLEVADCGTGMSKEILERIFDPFFTTKEVGVGTGLGLSLVHGIVTELGGAIDVASAPGAGSVFSVYFPRAGDASEEEALDEPAWPHGDRQQILVVDDEESLVRLTTENLTDLGYVPVGFTSSRAALEAFNAHPERYDAVITDERMAGMTGTTLIREIRNIDAKIPTLLVSGFVGGDLAARAKAAGADDVLKKPMSMRALANTLARVLRR